MGEAIYLVFSARRGEKAIGINAGSMGPSRVFVETTVLRVVYWQPREPRVIYAANYCTSAIVGFFALGISGGSMY